MPIPAIPIISTVLDTLGLVAKKAADKFFPDPKDELRRQELTNAINLAFMEHQSRLIEAASSVVVAEAKGESWLQRNWRPIAMLTFVGLIVAKWFGYGAPGITEAVEMKLWSIIEFGMGGYVVGRSCEKTIPAAASAIAAALKK